jgi:hypothetical protein
MPDEIRRAVGQDSIIVEGLGYDAVHLGPKDQEAFGAGMAKALSKLATEEPEHELEEIVLESGVIITVYEQMRHAAHKPKLGPPDCRPERLDELRERINRIVRPRNG